MKKRVSQFNSFPSKLNLNIIAKESLQIKDREKNFSLWVLINIEYNF